MENSMLLMFLGIILLIISFFVPKIQIGKEKTLNLNFMILALIFTSGFIAFFNGKATRDLIIVENEIPAFVFFDQSTEEKLAVYHLGQTNFSNHLRLNIQNRTEIDENLIELEILVTNNLEKALNFNPNYLTIIDETGQKLNPIEMKINQTQLKDSFEIESGASVLGSFSYQKPANQLNFQLKYLPIISKE